MCYGPEPIYPDGRTPPVGVRRIPRAASAYPGKDFCQIALQRRVPLEKSGVILFRIHPATPENFDPLVQALLKSNRVWPGNIGIVDASGIQMLPARRT